MYLETSIKKLSVANKKKILKGLPVKICLGEGDRILLTKSQQKTLSKNSSLDLSCSEKQCKKIHNFYNHDLIGSGSGTSRVAPAPAPTPLLPMTPQEEQNTFLENFNRRLMLQANNTSEEEKSESQELRDEMRVATITDAIIMDKKKMDSEERRKIFLAELKEAERKFLAGEPNISRYEKEYAELFQLMAETRNRVSRVTNDIPISEDKPSKLLKITKKESKSLKSKALRNSLDKTIQDRLKNDILKFANKKLHDEKPSNKIYAPYKEFIYDEKDDEKDVKDTIIRNHENGHLVGSGNVMKKNNKVAIDNYNGVMNVKSTKKIKNRKQNLNFEDFSNNIQFDHFDKVNRQNQEANDMLRNIKRHNESQNKNNRKN